MCMAATEILDLLDWKFPMEIAQERLKQARAWVVEEKTRRDNLK